MMPGIVLNAMEPIIVKLWKFLAARPKPCSDEMLRAMADKPTVDSAMPKLMNTTDSTASGILCRPARQQSSQPPVRNAKNRYAVRLVPKRSVMTPNRHLPAIISPPPKDSIRETCKSLNPATVYSTETCW